MNAENGNAMAMKRAIARGVHGHFNPRCCPYGGRHTGYDRRRNCQIAGERANEGEKNR
jgi:hypothetical protein